MQAQNQSEPFVWSDLRKTCQCKPQSKAERDKEIREKISRTV